MIISMQGNWKVTVKSKSAAFQQRFVVQGAIIGNGVHAGTPGTTANVIGQQWSISIQNNPGTGWQASGTQIKFPTVIGGNYSFDILSDDAGGDNDFNDLILTCSTPIAINSFVIYGNVTLYSGACVFNPCRRFPYVIDTYYGLEKAIKNPSLHDWIKKYYPERIPPIIVDPNPPDPPYFQPMVFDLTEEATQPKTILKYSQKPIEEKKKSSKVDNEADSQFDAANFKLISSSQNKLAQQAKLTTDKIGMVKAIDQLFYHCFTDAGSNLPLTFEEYDRTAAEISGGPYTGEGNRRLLGNAITDMNGNYIFKFSFDMTFPGLEDSSDIASGENVNTVMYPDVIVKVVNYSPFKVLYESAPFYNIPNLKRIDLCIPESSIHTTSACFNGNLIGGLGNVFLGGNQNTAGSTSTAALRRYGASNYLESTGKISVNSPLAGFTVECAAWYGIIDIGGCMYDESKPLNQNNIVWYTLEIRRSGTPTWISISENYKHPKHQFLNVSGYIGTDVGPFYPNPGGALNGSIPAYINIQREVHLGDPNLDWINYNLDRYMQLHTQLYDVIAGVRTPGKFYLRVRGYDSAGVHVAGATDLIALYIHNDGLKFQMTTPGFNDPSIVDAGCGLYRLTDLDMKKPINFSFEARDPYGFVDNYALTMGRCPGTPLNLTSNIEATFTVNSPGVHKFPGGQNASNVHDKDNPLSACPGYRGTQDDYSIAGLKYVEIAPPVVGDGWIKPGEYFTVYSFGLTANQRVTNGYNSGVSGTYHASSQILMERLNP